MHAGYPRLQAHTLMSCNTLSIAFPLQQLTHELISILRYTYAACHALSKILKDWPSRGVDDGQAGYNEKQTKQRRLLEIALCLRHSLKQPGFQQPLIQSRKNVE